MRGLLEIQMRICNQLFQHPKKEVEEILSGSHTEVPDGTKMYDHLFIRYI